MLLGEENLKRLPKYAGMLFIMCLPVALCNRSDVLKDFPLKKACRRASMQPWEETAGCRIVRSHVTRECLYVIQVVFLYPPLVIFA